MRTPMRTKATQRKGKTRISQAKWGGICENRGYDQKCYRCELHKLLIVDAVADDVAEGIDCQIG